MVRKSEKNREIINKIGNNRNFPIVSIYTVSAPVQGVRKKPEHFELFKTSC